MQRKGARGFTIVEIIVTLVVLVILTTLVIVRLTFTQVRGRDQERELDIATLATGLEVYYQTGSPSGSIPKGYYPGSVEVNAAKTTSPPFSEFLDGVSKDSFVAPNRTISDSFGANTAAGSNSDGSYTDDEARAKFSALPYLYQPLTRAGGHCFNYTDCVKFNLYYLEESTNMSGTPTGTVIKLRSKNQ